MPNKTLRIGIMIDELAPGSAPKVIGQEVKGLKAFGYDAEAIVFRKGYPRTYEFHLSDVPMVYLSERFPFVFRKVNMHLPGFSFFSFDHVANSILAPLFVHKHEWDAVIAHISYTCLTARHLSRFREIPYFAFIGTEPGYYLLPRIYEDSILGPFMPLLVPLSVTFDRYVVEGSLAILTYSKYYQNLIRAYTDKEIEIVYPGCFPVNKPSENRENFMFTFDRWDVGNLPHRLLDVLSQLGSDVGLVIAGYWYPEKLKISFLKEIENRGLSRRIKVLGPLDERGIIEWCSKALVHVHLNKEAFGMPSLEAAACGCPIIIPKGSGVTELFEDGIHGYFPEENDMNSFIKCIEKITTDPRRASEMGYKAWTVANKHTWMEHAKRIAQIVEEYID